MHYILNGNNNYKNGIYDAAMVNYCNAYIKNPELRNVILQNINRTKFKFFEHCRATEKTVVVVCAWELSHNSAGRAYALAQIHKQLGNETKILGCLIPSWGSKIWEPLRDSEINIYSLILNPISFIEDCIKLVAAHPANIVHLSKPRAPNVIFGILYKLIWGSKVVIDIDDYELGFVGGDAALNVDDYLKEYSKLPPLNQLGSEYWTRISVAMVHDFDAVTVSNVALKYLYGGLVVGHARDENIFKNSLELKERSRAMMNIPVDKKVILFLGTPRAHKGLKKTAIAIQKLRRQDVVFVIVGTFGNNEKQLKQDLISLSGVDYIFVDNKPFNELPNILSIADCCVILQDKSIISMYQIPAKLTDALAMSIPVLVSNTPALAELKNTNAVKFTTEETLSFDIAMILDKVYKFEANNARNFFLQNLSLKSNADKLRGYLNAVKNNPLGIELQKLFSMLSDITFR